MAAFYVDEEEVWKCPKHQSKRHRSGICPTCLREQLSSLCPDCAHVRPCGCAWSGVSNLSAGIGTVGQVTNLIEIEPAFRRSRSVAVPFMRSKSKSRSNKVRDDERIIRTKKTAFWGWLKGGNKSSSGGVVDAEEERRMMMRKSRSVAVTTSDYGNSKVGAKWYFRSPMKVFRQSRLAKDVVHERAPVYRG